MENLSTYTVFFVGTVEQFHFKASIESCHNELSCLSSTIYLIHSLVIILTDSLSNQRVISRRS